MSSLIGKISLSVHKQFCTMYTTETCVGVRCKSHLYSYLRRLIQDPFFGAVFSHCFVWPRITSLMYVPLLLLLQIPLPVTDVGHIQMKIHCSLLLYSLVLTLLTHLVRFSNNFQLLELTSSII